MKKRYRWIFFLIGVAGIGLLWLEAKPSEMEWKSFFDTKLILLLGGLLLLWGVIYLLHSFVYRLTLGAEGRKIPQISLLRICLSGFALNNVTPAGLVGGEPYRVLELKRFCSTEKAISSTLIFSILYIMGHVMLWTSGSLVYFLKGCPGSTAITVLFAVAFLICASLCVLFFAEKKRGLVVPLLNFLGKLPLVGRLIRRFLSYNRDVLEEIDTDFLNFRKDVRVFLRAALLQYLTRILECVEYFLILRYLGTQLNFFEGMLVLSTASLIGNLMFMIPMQAGVREGGMTLALYWLNVDSAVGLMAGLIYRIRELICIAIGILCILVERTIEKKEEQVETAASTAPEEEK